MTGEQDTPEADALVLHEAGRDREGRDDALGRVSRRTLFPADDLTDG